MLRGVMPRHRNTILPYNRNLRMRARELRNNATRAEIILWQEIKNRALGHQFHRQVPIDEFIVDFYCHELMLAIEVDGSSHESPEAQQNDALRQRRLESLGVRFIRFDNGEVMADMSSVLNGLRQRIAALPPSRGDGGCFPP